MSAPSISFNVQTRALGQVPTGAGIVLLMLGVCSGGTANTIYSYAGTASASQAASDLGIGPLSEAVQYQLAKTNTQIYVVPITPTGVAKPSAITQTGSGANSVAVVTTTSGITTTGGYSAWDHGSWVIKMISGGVVGTATFQFSKDGGTTYSTTRATAASVTVETGMAITFGSGTFVAGDLFSFTAYEPGFSTANMATAITAAFTPNNAYQQLLVAGSDMGTTEPPTDTAYATAYAARVTAVETALTTQATRFRFADAWVDGPRVAANTTSDNLIIAAFASTVGSDVSATAGMQTQINQLDGFQVPRSVGWCFAAKSRMVDLAQTTWARDVPIDAAILSIDTDSAVRPALDSANFATLTSMAGLQGFYGCQAPTLAVSGSNLNTIEANNVMNLAKTTAYAALAPIIGQTVFVDKTTGFITDASALGIEKTVLAQLRVVLTNTGGVKRASAVSFTVVRDNNILATKQLICNLGIVPLGYIKTIVVNISFTNPTVVAVG